MSITFRPAKRENLPLLIGLAGGTGSGKTYSALKLATGLAGGERFGLIDTESGRALHYADEFTFDHAPLEPPFTPDAYKDAIVAAETAGYPVIVVDSFSHEHAGEGGLLDWQEQELDRLAGSDARRREAMTFAAWVKPKMAHKRMVTRLLQVPAHVILCFRAEEKIEIAKENGRTVVRPKQSLVGLDGWLPVSEKNLPYELTLYFLLTADKPGVPKPIKLEDRHRPLVPLDRPLGEQVGQALAEWAAGGQRQTKRQTKTDDLTFELLDLAGKLGKREAVQTAIAANRADNSAAKHAAWLKKQIANAQAALAASDAAAEESNLFEAVEA